MIRWFALALCSLSLVHCDRIRPVAPPNPIPLPAPMQTSAQAPAQAPASAPAAPAQVRIISSVPPGAAPMLAINTAVQGTLEEGDQVLQDGSLGDDYPIMLTIGEPVTIVARGGQSIDSDGGVLDVQLLLLFNGHEVAADDDSARNGPALNSRVVFSPPITGLYIIRVSSAGTGVHHGTYTLQIYPGGLLRQL